MKKNHVLRTVLLSSVFALLAVFLLTPIVSAHRATTVISQVPDIPTVAIITRHHRSMFSQSTVNCQIQAGQPCLIITNMTRKIQVVLNLGHTLGTLQPGQSALISVSAGPGIYPMSLKANSQAILDVIAS